MRHRQALSTSQAGVLMLLVAVAAVPLSVGLGVGDIHEKLMLGFGMFGAAALFVGIVSRPIPAIAAFSALWAPTLFLTKEASVGVVGGFDLNISRMLGGVLVVALAARVALSVLRGRRLRAFPAPLIWYTAFALWLVIELLRSPVLGSGLGDIVRFAAGYLMILVIWLEIETGVESRLLHLAAVAGIAGSAAMTVGLWLLGPSTFVIKSRGAMRAIGSYGGANASGTLAVAGVAFLLPLFGAWISRRGTRGLWLGLQALLLAAIACTFSRTAILGVAVLAIFWLLTERSQLISRAQKAVVLVAIAGILAFGLSLMGDETLSRRLSDVPILGDGGISTEDAGSGRIGIWRYHWSRYVSGGWGRVLLGGGLGSSHRVARSMASMEGERVSHGPHNEYLWLLTETGVVGLAIYMGFLLTLGFSVWRMSRSTGTRYAAQVQILAGGFLAYLLSYQLTKELFGWGITKIGVRWYFLLFMVLALASRLIGAPQVHRATAAKGGSAPTTGENGA